MDGAPTRPARDDRRFLAWSAAAVAASTVAFTWMVTLGRWDLFAHRRFSDVFDLQARAMAAGTFTVPDGSLAFEGFVVDGRTTTYFGIFPSLLRLPLLAVTDRFDGRLTTVSMLVAYLVALWSCARLIQRIHRLARPDGAWTGAGLAVAVGTVATLGVGSNLMFLASASWVYHEASMWGAAGVLASFAAIVAHLLEPRPRHIAVAGAWAAVAWLSRGSVGLGPSVALAALALPHLVGHRWVRALVPGPPTGDHRVRAAVALLVAASVGALAFAAVNTAKFGGPTVLPMDKQVASQNPWPSRRAALEAYDGSLFSLRLVPATVAQSLRPDLVAPTGEWPFVRLTSAQPLHLGQPVFDTVEPSMGVTVTQPVLLALTGAGGWAVLRRRRRSAGAEDPAADPGLARVRPLLLGALVGCSAPLTIAFVAQRYLTDLLPLLLVAAAAGVAALDRWVAGRPPRPRVAAALTALAALALFGVATTVSTTWLYQRLEIPPDPAALAAGLRTQAAMGGAIGRPPAVEQADRLPAEPRRHRPLVLGDCAALYWIQGDGTPAPIEVRAAGGRHRLRVRRGALGPSAHTLLVIGTGAGRARFTLSAVGPDRVRVDLRLGSEVTEGTPFALAPGDTVHLDVVVDPNNPFTRVVLDGHDALYRPGPPPSGAVVVAPAGEPDGPPLALPAGQVRELDIAMPTCRALLGS